jgi:glycosyltransferase involved in cell wall biosynthesis
MHIFSFPSIWPETSCISAIESMAAGCQVVSTNLGALYETCSPFGTLVSFDKNLENLEKKYKKTLIESIENYWSEENQKKLKLQRETFNLTYSWNVRSKEWINFLKSVKN